MLYSSGTTGRPKGVRRPLPRVAAGDPKALIATVGLTAIFGMKEGDVYLSPAPLYHAAPLVFSSGQHRIGATTLIMRRFEAEEALRLIQNWKVTTSQWVPTHFKRLLSLPDAVRRRYDVSTLRLALHAAGQLRPVERAVIEAHLAFCPFCVDRLRELLAYSVSEEYFTVRRHLGLEIGA